jgi:hypothetical protein
MSPLTDWVITNLNWVKRRSMIVVAGSKDNGGFRFINCLAHLRFWHRQIKDCLKLRDCACDALLFFLISSLPFLKLCLDCPKLLWVCVKLLFVRLKLFWVCPKLCWVKKSWIDFSATQSSFFPTRLSLPRIHICELQPNKSFTRTNMSLAPANMSLAQTQLSLGQRWLSLTKTLMSLSQTNKSLEGSSMSLGESLKSWGKWAVDRRSAGLRAMLFHIGNTGVLCQLSLCNLFCLLFSLIKSGNERFIFISWRI